MVRYNLAIIHDKLNGTGKKSPKENR